MEFIKKYYTKYEEIIKYLFWGVMTTVVNFATFYLLIMCFVSVDGSWNALFNDSFSFFNASYFMGQSFFK